MVNKSWTMLPLALLAACNVAVVEGNEADGAPARPAPATAAALAPANVGAQDADFAFKVVEEPRPWQPNRILMAQVALDRWGFSPGILDGKPGQSFTAAVRGFQDSNTLPVTGEFDQKTAAALLEGTPLPTTWLVSIPEGFTRGPFFNIPRGLNNQAELPGLTYRNLLEKLAERFHTTPEALTALNPGKAIGPGAVIRVPAIANQPVAKIEGDARGWGTTLASLGVSADQPKADHIVVDKSEGLLKVYNAENRLIAQFPATMGSQHDPLPLGQWTIKGVSRNPDFHYNPALFWDASSKDEKAVLKPGPNGPVGVVWIDISKDHYGIHGTPEPQTIGRTESHGCIRLTNWDAARLAQMVTPGTKALFQA